jgi:lipid-A-disaccharide synthase
VVVIAPSERLDEALLHTVDRCKLQGVGVTRGSAAASISSGVIRLADSLGVFIAEVGNLSRDGAQGRV